MVRYTLTLMVFFVFSSSLVAQKCKDRSRSSDSPGILDAIFSSFFDNDDNQSSKIRKRASDVPRTEDLELRVGANFLIPTRIEGLLGAGIEVAAYKAIKRRPGLYMGGSIFLYSHGFQQYDTLFRGYDRINTSNTIYGLSAHMKQRVIDRPWVKGYFGLQTGMLIFHSYSRAVDLSCDCDKKPSKILQSQRNVRPSIGPTLDLQFPVGSKYDRFSIHVGYLFAGKTSFVKRNDVEIAPNQINFRETNKQLGLINIQIGYSMFF